MLRRLAVGVQDELYACSMGLAGTQPRPLFGACPVGAGRHAIQWVCAAIKQEGAPQRRQRPSHAWSPWRKRGYRTRRGHTPRPPHPRLQHTTPSAMLRCARRLTPETAGAVGCKCKICGVCALHGGSGSCMYAHSFCIICKATRVDTYQPGCRSPCDSRTEMPRLSWSTWLMH